jgi:hypothetical protein
LDDSPFAGTGGRGTARRGGAGRGGWRATHTGGYRSPIQSVRAGADDREVIIVVAWAGCERLDRIEVAEDATRALLAPSVRGSDRCGVDLGESHAVAVRLGAPLGGRRILKRDFEAGIYRTDA